MATHFKQVAIIGVGLIGGSLGMVLKRRGLADTVVGIGRRVENLKMATRLGAIDRYDSDPQNAVRDADLVVLASPVDTYERQVKEWSASLKPGTIVTDVGSVKGALVARLEALMPPGVEFVGAHPIAGKEKTGVAAGSASLFFGARCIVTPTERTSAHASQTICDVWEAAGATIFTMDPLVHDRVLGAVSHLPHVVVFSLMTALGEIQEQTFPGENLLAYGGGGLRDTTRIAGSSPEMWRDICLWNRENLIGLIETYEQQLGRLKGLIQAGDGPGLEKEMARANQLREEVE